MVDHDAIEPCSEATSILEGAELCKHLEQHLLCDVLRLLSFMNHANGDIKNPGLVPLDKLFECIPVPITCLSHKVLIRDIRDNRFSKWIIHSVLFLRKTFFVVCFLSLMSRDRSNIHL